MDNNSERNRIKEIKDFVDPTKRPCFYQDGDFLQTPYWKAVACRIRYKYKYKCALCDGKYNLRVHHKTYEHHGYEWFYPEDLILLYEDCHEKFHDIEGE